MISKILSYIVSIRLIFHIVIFYISSKHKLLVYERDKWLERCHFNKRGLPGLLLLLNTKPEYRSLFYLRTGQDWLRMFAKGQTNLEFYMPSENIGAGLVIWHGFSTVINAKKIGRDCQIWQNVVIGKKTSSLDDDRPTIGDKCLISAGAIVIGDICIADESSIGAGATVVKDVEIPGTVVVGQSARYIYK